MVMKVHIDIIIDFEKNKIPIIIKVLSKYGFNELISKIKYYNQLIVQSNTLCTNDFDFIVHLNSLYNFIISYDQIYTTCADSKAFLNIITSDFNLYWKNIKNLD